MGKEKIIVVDGEEILVGGEPDDAPKGKKKKGFIRREAAYINPFKMPLKAVGQARDSLRRSGALLGGFLSGNKGVMGRFFTAIYSPPHWSSIESLEADWHINDDNRDRTIKGMKRERFIWLFFCFVLLPAMLYGNMLFITQSAIWLVMFAALFLLGFFYALSKIAIASWRIKVLQDRVPMNFIQYLKDGGLSHGV